MEIQGNIATTTAVEEKALRSVLDLNFENLNMRDGTVYVGRLSAVLADNFVTPERAPEPIATMMHQLAAAEHDSLSR